MQTLEQKTQKIVIERKQIAMTRAQALTLRTLIKLGAMASRLKHKIIARQHSLLSLVNPGIILDKSSSEWKLIYSEPMQPADMIFNGEKVAGISVCDNPRSIDLEKLERNYPSAYADCLRPTGKHLRLIPNKQAGVTITKGLE